MRVNKIMKWNNNRNWKWGTIHGLLGGNVEAGSHSRDIDRGPLRLNRNGVTGWLCSRDSPRDKVKIPESAERVASLLWCTGVAQQFLLKHFPSFLRLPCRRIKNFESCPVSDASNCNNYSTPSEPSVGQIFETNMSELELMTKLKEQLRQFIIISNTNLYGIKLF